MMLSVKKYKEHERCKPRNTLVTGGMQSPLIVKMEKMRRMQPLQRHEGDNTSRNVPMYVELPCEKYM